MDAPDADLQSQLLEAGNKLLPPPSSLQDLLSLLHQVENFLSKVEQSPSESMQKALAASQKALISDPLLKHSDVEVKVAVASCISEITRITAPDAPYDDEKMKAVFHLIVSSFENLSDNSSPSFPKRVAILETVAKVRSCVVMLDLECDDLILEMFQCFLKNIRDYHQDNVFSSMERIMTLVLEESEDISVELLSPILDCVKKNNEEGFPIARKLGEKVLENCSTKLKPYITRAIKNLGVQLEDYSDIVASICQEAFSSAELDDLPAASKNTADESKSVEIAPDGACQGTSELVQGNNSAQTNADKILDELETEKKDGEHNSQSRNSKPDNFESKKATKANEKQERSAKKRGRKPNLQKSEHADSSLVNNKVTENLLASKRDDKKFARNSLGENPVIELMPSENEKETVVKSSSPIVLKNDTANVASPSKDSSLLEEKPTKRVGRPKKKKISSEEAIPSVDDNSKKISDATSDSEVKLNRRFGKKATIEVSDENTTSAAENASTEVKLNRRFGKKATIEVSDENTTSAAENASKKVIDERDEKGKTLKHSSVKVDERGKEGGGSSLKQLDEKKRQGQVKGFSVKDVLAPLAKDDKKKSTSKEEHDLEETPKSLKRKLTSGKEKDSDSKDLGENLVTSKIKVWWPRDQMFYEGVIESFDPDKKKHKVVYTDGDEEVLNLSKEKWEFIEEFSNPGLEQETPPASPDTSLDLPLTKKAMLNADESAKRGKMDPLLKKRGGTSSSKLQGSSGLISKYGSKVEGTSKDSEAKNVVKSLDNSRGKSKDHNSGSGSGKVSDSGRKSSGKLKKDDETPKASKSDDDVISRVLTKPKLDTPKAGKSKQENPVTSSVSKSKILKSGGKYNINGGGKMKASSRTKESGDVKECSSGSDSEKAPEGAKGRLIKPSDAEGGRAAKSGEKRKRGAKSR